MKPETYKKYRFVMKLWHGYLLPLILLGMIAVVVVLFYRDVSTLRERQENYVQQHTNPQEQKMDNIEKKLDLIIEKMNEEDQNDEATE